MVAAPPSKTIHHVGDAASSATVIAGYGIAIANALEYNGVDSKRIFHAVGINEPIPNDPLHRLPENTITRLYKACVEVTHNPYFGLTVAKFLHASNLHALGYGLLASSTLLDFLHRLERHMAFLSLTASMEVCEAGCETQLIAHMHTEACAETQDAWAAFLVRFMRLINGGKLEILRLELPHAMPADGAGPYIDLFRAPVLFDRPAFLLALPRELMTLPLQGACPELAQFNDKLATEYLAKIDRHDVVACTRARIIELLPSGQCSRDQVAEALCMSPAKLQAKLTQRNTNFHNLLSQIREEFARAYLRQPSISITEITYLLGFTDISNFTRAFKRWTGISPSEFRKGDSAK